jgi:alanine-synthesizing transaminase
MALRTEALRGRGAELIDLAETNPTRCGFAYPERELAAALSCAEVGRYEPDPKGMSAAREALASRWRRDGVGAGPEQIVLCSGTSEAYAYLFKLLCDPGDNVLVPRPSYPLLEFIAALESVNLRPYPLQFAGEWQIDLGALAEAFDQRTKAVLAINPGYPTGSFLKGAELDSLSALCAERRCALICDEVFSDYAVGESPERVATVLGRASPALTFALSGLSKKAGLPQAKIAWLGASGPEQVWREALARLEIIADTYLSSSPVLQSALPRLLELADGMQQQIRRRLIENRSALLAGRPSAARWSVLPSEGGWSSILRLAEDSDEESICLELLDRGLIVQPGYFFDFPRGKFLVLSLIVPRQSFDRGLEILASTI